MEYRTLGESDVEVTPIAMGTWAIGGWMWGGRDDEAAIDGLRRSIDLGMTTIDTAPVYGFGHSEEIVGEAIQGRRDEVEICTKFGLRWDMERGVRYFDTTDSQGNQREVYKYAGRQSVIEECERSLGRLRVDCIDLFQQHWPDASTPIEETMAACEELLNAGKIRAVGVSNYTPEMMEEARKVVPVASNQPPYSMLRRDIEKDVLPYCIENDIGLLVYSPLEGGILTGKVTPDREFPETDKRSSDPLYSVENRKRVLDFLERIKPVAEKHDATFAQLVLAWTAAQPGVTSVLVGVRNAKQAEENAGAGEIELSADDVETINAELQKLELDA